MKRFLWIIGSLLEALFIWAVLIVTVLWIEWKLWRLEQDC